MSASKVARRYSKALVNLCNKDNSHDQVASQLDTVVKGLSEAPGVLAALTNPVVGPDVREQVLKQITSDLKIDGLTANFLFLLGERLRMDELEGILEDFRVRMDDLAGRVRATVTSAAILSAADSNKIKAQLEKTTGKTVILETSVDPSLLGGVVTRVGNLVLDGSIQTALGSVRERLLGSVH